MQGERGRQGHGIRVRRRCSKLVYALIVMAFLLDGPVDVQIKMGLYSWPKNLAVFFVLPECPANLWRRGDKTVKALGHEGQAGRLPIRTGAGEIGQHDPASAGQAVFVLNAINVVGNGVEAELE